MGISDLDREKSEWTQTQETREEERWPIIKKKGWCNSLDSCLKMLWEKSSKHCELKCDFRCCFFMQMTVEHKSSNWRFFLVIKGIVHTHTHTQSVIICSPSCCCFNLLLFYFLLWNTKEDIFIKECCFVHTNVVSGFKTALDPIDVLCMDFFYIYIFLCHKKLYST